MIQIRLGVLTKASDKLIAPEDVHKHLPHRTRTVFKCMADTMSHKHILHRHNRCLQIESWRKSSAISIFQMANKWPDLGPVLFAHPCLVVIIVFRFCAEFRATYCQSRSKIYTHTCTSHAKATRVVPYPGNKGLQGLSHPRTARMRMVVSSSSITRPTLLRKVILDKAFVSIGSVYDNPVGGLR